MISGKENALKWFDTTGCTHWIIYAYGKSDSGFLVMRSTESDSLTKEQGYSELSLALSIMNGRYTISAMPGVKRSPKGDFKEDIEVSTTTSMGGIPQQGLVQQVTGFSKEDVQAEIKKAIEEERTRVKLENLEKENRELKKENKELEQSANGWIQQVVPHIAPHLGKIFGQPRALAGIDDAGAIPQTTTETNMNGTATAQEVEITDDEHQRLSAVVNVFMAADPEGWLVTLEKMAAKVQSNPSVLNTLKAFL
jgi:hypothetical protein